MKITFYSRAVKVQWGLTNRFSGLAPRSPLTSNVNPAVRTPSTRKPRQTIQHFSKRAYFRFLKFCLQTPRQIPYMITLSPRPDAFDRAKKAMLELLQHLRKRHQAKWIWRIQISPEGHPHFHILLYNTTKELIQKTWAKIRPVAANIKITRPNKKNLSYMLRKGKETMRNRKNPTGRYWGHSNNFEIQGETIHIPKNKIKIVTRILKRYKPDIDQFQEGWIFGNEYTIQKIRQEILEAIGPNPNPNLVHDSP